MVEAEGECNRLLAGVQHTAKVRVQLEPFEMRGPLAKQAPPVITTNVIDHGLTPQFLSMVLEELEIAGQGSGILGFPLMRLKVTVLGGEVHVSDSSEIAFRTAGNVAFNNALHQAGPILLEPIMKLELATPGEHVGDLVSDLQQRRAISHQTASRGTDTVLHAEAPLANLFGYSSAMRSLSQGRASCSMEPSCYAAAPEEVMKRFLGEE